MRLTGRRKRYLMGLLAIPTIAIVSSSSIVPPDTRTTVQYNDPLPRAFVRDPYEISNKLRSPYNDMAKR